MSSDRWRRVEDLCHAALEHPVPERAAFLAEACGGDAALRREVESLISHEAEAAGFMSTPAAGHAASALLKHARGTLLGHQLGRYSIKTLIGVGGMGEVYRAHDATLGRDVAIKVLPPAFIDNAERRARFEREARMLASLNHPNIAAIYGVEESDGVRGLVLELVEGETLADRIGAAPAASGGTPAPRFAIPEALVIARQIAEALDAAHEKGIVHRDLKPANIKITSDGLVKVLDFGLAKDVGPDARADPAQSHDGLILGTAAYMSPEQARGQSVDKRSDIWSFGCVLFEMLTGRPTFPGDTVSDTIARILEREPDWSALPAQTPLAIRRLLLRCLAKDPRRRLRDIGDARNEIDALDENLPGVEEPRAAPGRRATSPAAWMTAAVLAVIAVGLAVWGMRTSPPVNESLLADARFSRLTDWPGMESFAEISPDGKFVVFLSDRDGRLDLWVSQIGTGNFRNVTANLSPLSAPAGVLRSFGFSGDGEIWFTQAGDASAPKFLMPLSGGIPRPFLGQGKAAPSWSRDDTRLAFFTNDGGDPLSIADRTSANARPIPVKDPSFFSSGMHSHNPIWSADGEWLYFAHGKDPTEEMDVWRVRPSGGVPEQLTSLHAAASFLASIDDQMLLYVARAPDRTGPWLWSLDAATRIARRVASGLDHYTSVSASRDGRRIVATVSNPNVSLWRVPLVAAQADDRDVQPYPVSMSRALAPRFGGDSLFYLSSQGAGDGLWRWRGDAAFLVWKADNDSLSEPPAVSRDGSRVAVIAMQDGKRRLSIMSDDGTNVQTLAPSIVVQGAGGQGSADWSPDGAWLVVAGTDAQGPGVFRVAVDGSAPVRLASGQLSNPVCSPDGTLIVYGGPAVGGQVPLLGVRPDGTAVTLPDVRARLGGGHRFLRDGTGLVYLPRLQSHDFWLLDLTTKETRPLTRLHDDGRLNTFDITPDGRAIVFDRSHDNSDVVLIERPR